MASRSHWSPADTKYLVAAWEMKVRAMQIAVSLGRADGKHPDRAIKNRMRDHHRDVWNEVDHPDNPRKREAKPQAVTDVAEALAGLQATIEKLRESVVFIDGKLSVVLSCVDQRDPETDVPPQEPKRQGVTMTTPNGVLEFNQGDFGGNAGK